MGSQLRKVEKMETETDSFLNELKAGKQLKKVTTNVREKGPEKETRSEPPSFAHQAALELQRRREKTEDTRGREDHRRSRDERSSGRHDKQREHVDEETGESVRHDRNGDAGRHTSDRSREERESHDRDGNRGRRANDKEERGRHSHQQPVPEEASLPAWRVALIKKRRQEEVVVEATPTEEVDEGELRRKQENLMFQGVPKCVCVCTSSEGRACTVPHPPTCVEGHTHPPVWRATHPPVWRPHPA